ncbi:hydroxymethylglutaryl-CoA reductase, degradative [Irregularibacter muris]|uniref:3-hydroxy-3-methylglutaryl coenzyme A reductase n=1 Tax=Irregularibacter muris TaxID=1796619 RepID=A0AAE3L0F4_9FIRM|nr:hydroxymethylglutaryl-CoA reductase, degradative [Irregularibacter muris]MCR1899837.1 hydroxymethylglutaryl-CoA reductase, degradative [Irregularibacter muris]
MKTSSYSGFYKLSTEKRLDEVGEFSNLTDEEKNLLRDPASVNEEIADHMVENVIGRFTLPLGVGINFVINGKDYVVPMVTEEPSVIAATSNAAKMARENNGFFASYTGSIMISQIQITNLTNPSYAAIVIQEHRDEIIRRCNEQDPVLVKFGGGVEDVETRIIDTLAGKMLIVHLKVNTLDAMGANAVNTMAEYIAPYLEEITEGTVYLRILSNLAMHRLARSRVIIKKDILGEKAVDSILQAYAFAEADPFRAATHNKGIMNGIVPVVLATGNDTRAIESGAHAYASITGRYLPLTTWEKNANGDLVGTIEIPMAVGLVGGATKVHPQAKVAVKMLGVEKASDLAMIIASVGLAQNLAALKALATEGIQRGHMSLHARNLATTVGAKGELLDKIVSKMIKEKKVRMEYAQELFNQYSK